MIVHNYGVAQAKKVWTEGGQSHYCPHCGEPETQQTRCLAEKGYYTHSLLMQCASCKEKYQYSD